MGKSSTDNSVSVSRRVGDLDWQRVASDLDQDGCSTTARLLTAAECRRLGALYQDDGAFRSRVVMARYGFGEGEYRYLSYPLPGEVQTLRENLYPPLAAIANRWCKALGERTTFPATLAKYIARCHRSGQSRPTPLILRYGRGDYNCLHQDLYGELVFPLQVTVLLSNPERDFSGGEFMLVENRPRRQARGRVIRLRQGEAVIFPVRHRPVHGTRGYYRATMRHGVSALHTGERLALGIIFHDAA